MPLCLIMKKERRTGKDIALCGVMSALILVLLLTDLLIPTATIALAATAGALVFAMSVEYSTATSVVVYVVTVALCGLLRGGTDPVIFWMYTILFGLYGALKRRLDTLSHIPMKWISKTFFALLAGGAYGLVGYVLFATEGTDLFFGVTKWIYLLAALAYFVLFMIYDFCLTKLAEIYLTSFRKRLFPDR